MPLSESLNSGYGLDVRHVCTVREEVQKIPGCAYRGKQADVCDSRGSSQRCGGGLWAGAGGAAGYASADFVWLLDSRDSSARVAWRGGADGSSHEVRYTQSARQGQQIRQHTASLGSLALVGVAYEALMAYVQRVQ